jgi:outer membrane protein OmpA-like peptidoglycan-associated protein
MAIKPLPRLILIASAVACGWYGINRYVQRPRADGLTSSAIPGQVDVPVAGSASAAGDAPPVLATAPLAPATGDYTARTLVLPWNAVAGLAYANGDVTTAADSLMARHGVHLALERQDDYAQMVAEQALFAGEVAAGVAHPSKGAAFVVIMGDALPGYAAAAKAALDKMGQQIEVVGALGYSRGEDKCMLPAEVVADPQKARGSLIGAVLRDGDWNICIKYAADNRIPVNADPKTYDPDAMNFVSVGAFTEADEKLIAASKGACETRPVVRAGQATGTRRTVCQNGTATWTPGDVKVAREVGGLAAVASTKEYMWQMPAAIIGNKQWMAQNAAFVRNLLAASFEASDAVKASDANLLAASTVMAKVMREQTPEWWAKYHRGVVEKDARGLDIRLGGSTTNNLADNLYLLGLNGNDNLYKRVYTVYGGIAKSMYPQDMPVVLPYESVVNSSYVQALASDATAAAARPATPVFDSHAPATSTFAKRSWAIEFDTGKATFRPQAMPVLDQMLDQVAVSGLAVQVSGHTDNVGDPAANLALSKRRAEAVSSWLQANASSSFPKERVRTRAYGDQQPVAANDTAEGRARNRRVDIALIRTE